MFFLFYILKKNVINDCIIIFVDINLGKILSLIIVIQRKKLFVLILLSFKDYFNDIM